jgi:hypothetical protein
MTARRLLSILTLVVAGIALGTTAFGVYTRPTLISFAWCGAMLGNFVWSCVLLWESR